MKIKCQNLNRFKVLLRLRDSLHLKKWPISINKNGFNIQKIINPLILAFGVTQPAFSFAKIPFFKTGANHRCENLLIVEKTQTLAEMILNSSELWAQAKQRWDFGFFTDYSKPNLDQQANLQDQFLKALDKLKAKTYRTVGEFQNQPSVFYMSRKQPFQILKEPGLFPDSTLLNFEMNSLFDSRFRKDQSIVMLSSRASANPFDNLSLLEIPDFVVSTQQYQLMDTNYNKNPATYRIKSVNSWTWDSIALNKPLQWKINEGLEFLPTQAVWVFYQYEFANVSGAPLNFAYGDSYGVVTPFIDFAASRPLRFRKVAVLVNIPYLPGHESSALSQTYRFDENAFYNPSSLVNYTQLIYSDWQDMP